MKRFIKNCKRKLAIYKNKTSCYHCIIMRVIHNKIPIRDAYRYIVPEPNRKKIPIGSGSGMDFLTEYFDNLITDKEFEKLKEEYFPIKFLSKEHMYYFRIWKNLFFKDGTEYANYWKYGSYGSWEFYFN